MTSHKIFKTMMIVGSFVVLLLTAVSVSAIDDENEQVTSEEMRVDENNDRLSDEEITRQIESIEETTEDGEPFVIAPAPDDGLVHILDENVVAQQESSSAVNAGLPALGAIAIVVGVTLSVLIVNKKKEH